MPSPIRKGRVITTSDLPDEKTTNKREQEQGKVKRPRIIIKCSQAVVYFRPRFSRAHIDDVIITSISQPWTPFTDKTTHGNADNIIPLLVENITTKSFLPSAKITRYQSAGLRKPEDCVALFNSHLAVCSDQALLKRLMDGYKAASVEAKVKHFIIRNCNALCTKLSQAN